MSQRRSSSKRSPRSSRGTVKLEYRQSASQTCDEHHWQNRKSYIKWASTEVHVMTTATISSEQQAEQKTAVMKALVFHGSNRIAIETVPKPKPGYGEAVIRVTLTTI
jgi:hypothetical protein